MQWVLFLSGASNNLVGFLVVILLVILSLRSRFVPKNFSIWIWLLALVSLLRVANPLEENLFKLEVADSFNLQVLSTPEESRQGEWSFKAQGPEGRSFLARAPMTLWPRPQIGQDVVVDGSIKNCGYLDAPPALFSWCGYLYRRGVRNIIFVDEIQIPLLQIDSDPKASYSELEQFIASLFQEFPKQEEAVSLVVASVLGKKHLLGKELVETFRVTGLSHLLVVSGFHIGVFFSAVYFLSFLVLRRFVSPLYFFPRRSLQSFLSFLPALVYLWIVGLRPTGFRAILVLAIASLAVVKGREVFGLRSYLLSILLVVSVWPGVWLEMGFQLTFAALAGIFAGLSLGANLIQIETTPAMVKFINLCSVCTGAWIGTAPIIYFWTGFFSFLPPFANIIVSPLFSIVCIAFGSFSLLLHFFDVPGASILLNICLFATDIVIFLVRFLERMFS